MGREHGQNVEKHAVRRVDQHEIVPPARRRIGREPARGVLAAGRSRPRARACRGCGRPSRRRPGRPRRRSRSRLRARELRAPSRPSRRRDRARGIPSTGPMRLNTASRTRSPVGRVSRPLGAKIRAPLREPAMIRNRAGPPRASGASGSPSSPAAGARPIASPARSASGRASGSRTSGRGAPTGACRAAGPRRAARGRPRRAEAVVVSTSACRRRCASSVSSSFGRETSRQYDCSAPRPTRPRSWWSCASPKRSASWTIMIVAFGTSTPDLDHRRRHEDVELAALELLHDGAPLAPVAAARGDSRRGSRGAPRCRSRSASCSAARASIVSDSETSGQTT